MLLNARDNAAVDRRQQNDFLGVCIVGAGSSESPPAPGQTRQSAAHESYAIVVLTMRPAPFRISPNVPQNRRGDA